MSDKGDRPRAGDVWERGGARRTVTSATFSGGWIKIRLEETRPRSQYVFTWLEWQRWAASAVLVERDGVPAQAGAVAP